MLHDLSCLRSRAISRSANLFNVFNLLFRLNTTIFVLHSIRAVLTKENHFIPFPPNNRNNRSYSWNLILVGSSLHVSHFTALRTATFDGPFRTLSFGIFLSNLHIRDLKTATLRHFKIFCSSVVNSEG